MTGDTEKPSLCDMESKLFDLIQNGEYDESLKIVQDSDINYNCADSHGMSLLQHACFKGNIPLAKELLSRGADVNYSQHEHGYTTLMFAALSGNAELCQILLEAGAKTHKTNRIGRTASEMAAFTGQHHCVSVINNFLSQDDIEYWNHPPGASTDRISRSLIPCLHVLSRTYNVTPVKTVLFLCEHCELFKEENAVLSFLEDLVDVQMKQKDANEIMALKLHIIHRTLRAAFRYVAKQKEKDPGRSETELLPRFAKALLTSDKLGEWDRTELLLRQAIKEFPHRHSALFQTIVKSLASNDLMKGATAVNCIHQTLLGQRLTMDETFCSACGEGKALKRCSACKSVNYCSERCQKLHWPAHKPFCSNLKETVVQ